MNADSGIYWRISPAFREHMERVDAERAAKPLWWRLGFKVWLFFHPAPSDQYPNWTEGFVERCDENGNRILNGD